MARFKVFKQIGKPKRIGQGQYSYIARVRLIDGEIVPGLIFCGYETHHPVEFVIRTVQPESEGMFLIDCLGDWGQYEDFLTGTFIDTSGTKRGVHFFWDHEMKYGPHDDSVN